MYHPKWEPIPKLTVSLGEHKILVSRDTSADAEKKNLCPYQVSRSFPR